MIFHSPAAPSNLSHNTLFSLPFYCELWNSHSMVCLIFLVLSFFSVMAVPLRNYFPRCPFKQKIFYLPPKYLRPGGGIRVLPVFHQLLNSLSTSALSFISLWASLKLFPSSYSMLSKLFLAIIYWHLVSPSHIRGWLLAKSQALLHCHRLS